MVSIILPTYNEAENVEPFIVELGRVMRSSAFEWEVIVVDDSSPDGTSSIARRLAKNYPVRVFVRQGKRGLSKAIMKGFELAKGDICLVMDADFSHPLDRVPDMVKPILEGKCDATVGSRKVSGGGAENWPLIRRAISRFAGFLAKGVTTLSDPTSGFMAIRKSCMDLTKLDPMGWKFVLEVIAKLDLRVIEVPIIFKDRKAGKSKLGLRAQVDYLRHLWRLYCRRYRIIPEFLKFCLVGLSGFFVDTAVLISLVDLLCLDPRLAAVFAFLVAVSWNYALDRLWAFDLGRRTKISHSYMTFVAIYIFGLGIRIGVMHLFIEYAGMEKGHWYVLASFFGIVAATLSNFLGSKYIAFSKLFSRS